MLGGRRRGRLEVGGPPTQGLHFFPGTCQSAGSLGSLGGRALCAAGRGVAQTSQVSWPQAQLSLLSLEAQVPAFLSPEGLPPLSISWPLLFFAVTLRTDGLGRWHPQSAS